VRSVAGRGVSTDPSPHNQFVKIKPPTLSIMKKTFPKNPMNPFPPSSFHISNEGTLKKTPYLHPPSLSTIKIKNKK